jgi:hypothetical protein
LNKLEKNTEIFQYTTDDFHSDGNDILVLGIGNYLMGDEGIGVQFIQNLDTAKFPQNISFRWWNWWFYSYSIYRKSPKSNYCRCHDGRKRRRNYHTSET